MSEEHYLTKDGEKQIREELKHLEGPMRNDLARRLREAIQMGDLSENADYIAAKEEQGFLEGRILELKYILSHATIINENGHNNEIVEIGSTVTIQEENYPPEIYFLVGSKEAGVSFVISFGISSRVNPMASFAAILAIGKPVAFEARAELRLTRGFISIIMTLPLSGFTANCIFEPPVSTPISRIILIAISLRS